MRYYVRKNLSVFVVKYDVINTLKSRKKSFKIIEKSVKI